MKLNPATFALTADDGTDLGHALDHLRNEPHRHADVKAVLDQAWHKLAAEAVAVRDAHAAELQGARDFAQKNAQSATALYQQDRANLRAQIAAKDAEIKTLHDELRKLRGEP